MAWEESDSPARQWVWIVESEPFNEVGDIWISQRTGNEPRRCPFFREATTHKMPRCTIYEERPNVCRRYPVNLEQMVDDECEMLEPADHLLSKKAFRAELRRIRPVKLLKPTPSC